MAAKKPLTLVNYKFDITTDIYMKLSKGTHSMVLEECAWFEICHPVFCRFDAALAETFHVSQQSFANGILSFVINKKSDCDFKKFAFYRFRNLNEMQVTQKLYVKAAESWIPTTSADRAWEAYRCSKMLKDKSMFASSDNLDIGQFLSTFKLMMQSLIAVTLVLILEFFVIYLSLPPYRLSASICIRE
ncbi:hypothetical protein HDE_09211 [Halotydeus destructor]|nr:hypothetical protein HDE_09211 [Halotydeus destructor]